MVVVGYETRSVQSYQFGIEMYIVARIAVIFYVVQSYQFGIEILIARAAGYVCDRVQSYQFGIEITSAVSLATRFITRSIVPVWN